MNSSSNNNDWRTVPERQQHQYRGGRPQYGRPRPAFQPPLPPPESPLKKTEANFPKLVPNAPKKASPEFATSFSKTVAEMAAVEERDRLRDAYEKEQAMRAQNEFQGVYILGSVHSTRPTFARDLVDEFDETDIPFEREEYDTNPPPPNTEDDGWTQVKEKVRKPKRELTAAELAAKYIAAGEAADREEEEFNGELFAASHRHDHH